MHKHRYQADVNADRIKKLSQGLVSTEYKSALFNCRLGSNRYNHVLLSVHPDGNYVVHTGNTNNALIYNNEVLAPFNTECLSMEEGLELAFSSKSIDKQMYYEEPMNPGLMVVIKTIDHVKDFVRIMKS